MKVVVFLVSLVLFVASFALFGYAFSFGDPWNGIIFFVGVLAASVALMIPFHLLEKFD